MVHQRHAKPIIVRISSLAGGFVPRATGRVISGRSAVAMQGMRSSGEFGAWPFAPLAPALFFEIFGSGIYWCGALRGISRDQGRGWGRLRGGSRPTGWRRGAGRTDRRPKGQVICRTRNGFAPRTPSSPRVRGWAVLQRRSLTCPFIIRLVVRAGGHRPHGLGQGQPRPSRRLPARRRFRRAQSGPA